MLSFGPGSHLASQAAGRPADLQIPGGREEASVAPGCRGCRAASMGCRGAEWPPSPTAGSHPTFPRSLLQAASFTGGPARARWLLPGPVGPARGTPRPPPWGTASPDFSAASLLTASFQGHQVLGVPSPVMQGFLEIVSLRGSCGFYCCSPRLKTDRYFSLCSLVLWFRRSTANPTYSKVTEAEHLPWAGARGLGEARVLG